MSDLTDRLDRDTAYLASKDDPDDDQMTWAIAHDAVAALRGVLKVTAIYRDRSEDMQYGTATATTNVTDEVDEAIASALEVTL
jgi:hypothetical protein